MQLRRSMQSYVRPYPGPWITSTFVRDPATELWSNVFVPGANLLTANPGFEGTYVGGLAPNWNLISGTPLESADAYSGDKAQRMKNAAADYGSVSSTPTIQVPAGTWIEFSSRFKTISGTARIIGYQANPYSELIRSDPFSAAEYAFKNIIGRTINAATLYVLVGAYYHGTANTNDALVDDARIKTVSISKLIALRNMGRADLSYWGAPVVVSAKGHHAGVIGWATPDGLYQICARHDRTNVVLEKCVNGAYTVLVNAAAAYADSRSPVIVREDATHFHVKYNDIKVGATQEITDAGIINNTHFGMILIGGTIGDPVYAYA